MSNISNFYQGETKTFNITLKIDNVAQDIRNDTVTFRMKTARDVADGFATLEKVADVATDGATGIARFTLSPSDTKNIDEATYVCDVEWVTSGGDEYIAYDGSITVKERVSAPPS